MNVFCLLTGRGNNTLKHKNIIPVLGKPVLKYPALAAKQVISDDNLYVSSDDDRILEAASEEGFRKIMRPKEISGPTSKHIDAIIHGLEFIRQDTLLSVDILVVILANSATIKSKWIAEGIELINGDPTISAVVPAYVEQDHHPYRAKRLNKHGFLVPYFDFGDEFISTNRQELEGNYFLSHNFWVLNVPLSIESTSGLKPWAFMGERVKPIIVEDCFDIHTLDDVARTEAWLKNNWKN